ncbi:MAG: hypothetical protein K1X44_07095 [Alphaproteobacteria bacterium]|nr:hypothetical protein [Alphaproteobacteria bacterium]
MLIIFSINTPWVYAQTPDQQSEIVSTKASCLPGQYYAASCLYIAFQKIKSLKSAKQYALNPNQRDIDMGDGFVTRYYEDGEKAFYSLEAQKSGIGAIIPSGPTAKAFNDAGQELLGKGSDIVQKNSSDEKDIIGYRNGDIKSVNRKTGDTTYSLNNVKGRPVLVTVRADGSVIIDTPKPPTDPDLIKEILSTVDKVMGYNRNSQKIGPFNNSNSSEYNPLANDFSTNDVDEKGMSVRTKERDRLITIPALDYKGPKNLPSPDPQPSPHPQP